MVKMRGLTLKQIELSRKIYAQFGRKPFTVAEAKTALGGGVLLTGHIMGMRRNKCIQKVDKSYTFYGKDSYTIVGVYKITRSMADYLNEHPEKNQ